jgi:hypothetical protein
VTAVDSSMQALPPVAAGGTATPAPRLHFSFADALDIVNPLQHLPLIGVLYRKLTHDEIGTPEKIIGDTLFGGLPGLISSVADTAFERITGKNFADTALSLFEGSDEQPKLAATELAAPEMTLANVTPTLAYGHTDESLAANAAPAKPMSEQQITAALNRAQIRLALATRASSAYARAGGLTITKPTDLASAAY